MEEKMGVVEKLTKSTNSEKEKLKNTRIFFGNNMS